MQPSVEWERQIEERNRALEAAYLQLARKEDDLRALQAQYLKLVEQLAAERKRAETLLELSGRFGLR